MESVYRWFKYIYLKRFKEYGSFLYQAYLHWVDDKAFKMAAALSFYTLFSIIPLLVIFLAILGFVYGQNVAKGELLSEIKTLIGAESADAISALLTNVTIPGGGTTATIISSIIMIVASVIVFVELKESLNVIWGVEVRPGKGFKNVVKSRILSFVLVLAMGFLLIISLFVSTFISALNAYVSDLFPVVLPILRYSDILLSFLYATVLFGIIFKYLPSVKIEWRFIWRGALLTSFLFSMGKVIIGYVLAMSNYGNVFGAAGSLVVLLFWIYYSSLIFFFGAELTQVYRANRTDKPVKTSKDVMKIDKVSDQLGYNSTMKKNGKKTR